MNNKITKLFKMILLVTGFLAIFKINVFADNVQLTSVGFYDIKPFKESQKLDMPKNELSYYFNLSEGISLNENCFINLHFTFSNTLIDERSNITILINDYPIDTKWIYDLEENFSGWWKLSIPTSKFKLNSFNKLTIQTNQRSIEGDCADYDNPSNWILIHDDSILHLELGNLPYGKLANFYPIYFDSPWLSDGILCDFVLSKDFGNGDISNVYKIASAIGKNYPYRTLVDYNIFSDINSLDTNNNKIYLGLNSKWDKDLLLNFDNKNITNNKGIISILEPDSSYNYYSTLLSGNDEIGLNKAVDFLSNKTILDQIKDNSVVVNTQTPIEKSQNLTNKELYYFSDFGYEDINMEGAFHQESNLSFIQPNGIQNVEGSYINIKFNHSKVLDSDKSIITAYINGIAINSAKLSNGNAEDGELKVLLPPEALENSTIELKIDCYNYLGKIDCSKDYYESAWTVIKADSQISFIQGENILQPQLKPFPFFYSSNNDKPAEILVGLSSNTNLDLLEGIAELATRAGQNTGEVLDWFIVNDTDSLTEEQKNMDMIFVNYTDDLNIPKEVQEQLLIQPLGDGNFNINEDIQVTLETLQDKLILQVIRSPWDSTKRIYVVLCQNEENIKLFKKVLDDRDLLNEIDGQASIVDSNGDAYNITKKENKLVVINKTFKDRLIYLENKTNIPLWGLLIILLLIIIGFLLIYRLKRRKNEFGKVGEKLKQEQGFETHTEMNTLEKKQEIDKTSSVDKRLDTKNEYKKNEIEDKMKRSHKRRKRRN